MIVDIKQEIRPVQDFAQRMAKIQQDLINDFHAEIERIADLKLSVLGHKFPTKKSKDRFYSKRVLRVVDKDSGMSYLYLDFKTKRILLVAFDPQTITIHD